MGRFCAVFGILIFAAVLIAAGDWYPHTAVASATTATATSTLQEQINANEQDIVQLNQEIAQYEAELEQVGADKKTLQSAITALDLQRKKVEKQLSATKSQIDNTQLQIRQLGTGIVNAQQQIEANQSALGEGLRSLQEADNQPLVLVLLSSSSFSQAWDDTAATLEVQSAVQEDIQTLKIQENNLADSKAASQQKQNALTSQKQSLAMQETSLVQTKESKAQLLAETNAKESTYQQLLATAEAELTNFTTFTQNAGGAGLLANQTSCDSWGCYYNQRDSLWGNDALNGTQYQLKSDGCLITAMAMVMTHYGYRDVTPSTINSNPSNFAAYYPAYLLFTIHADGVSATRKTALIDATLSTGNPVIVGLHAYGGTHYVVLVSGSRGRYLMRDPYISGGKDISFTAHYSIKAIFGISKVQIGG